MQNDEGVIHAASTPREFNATVSTVCLGENAPPVRARLCEGLKFLGIELDESHNAETAGVISTNASRVTVRVIRTDEKLMIARSVLRSCAATVEG